MDYSPGVQFQKSLVNVDKTKALAMNNQLVKSMDKGKRWRCVSLEHLHVTSKEFPVGISYRNSKNSLEMGLSQQEAKSSAEDALSQADKICFMP